MIATGTLFSHSAWRGPGGRLVASLALAVLLVPICVLWVDRPLAEAVAHWLPPSRTLPSAPDLLVPFVAGVSSIMLLVWAWILLTGHGGPRLARLAPLLAFGLPTAFGLKVLGKWAFGRTETRMFLSTSHPCDFCHWLDGHGPYTGFPSGHMLVVTTALVLITACYPRLRRAAVLLSLALAAALVLSSYHFLSDIIAGALAGYSLARLMLLADAALRRAAVRRKPS